MISSIWSWMCFSWYSLLIGIFSNCVCPITTASYSPVAILPMNLFLFFGSKSFLSATIILADGYNCINSLPIWPVRWFGTTKSDLLHIPSLLLSIAEATISKVFPLPTTWARSVFPPYKLLAIAFFWWGLSSISVFIPSKDKLLPSYSLLRIELKCSLYSFTSLFLLSWSLNIQFLNSSFRSSCFCPARSVSFLFSTEVLEPSGFTIWSNIFVSLRFKASSISLYALTLLVP